MQRAIHVIRSQMRGGSRHLASLSFSYAAKEAVAIQREASRAVAVYITRKESAADGLRAAIGSCYYRAGEAEIILLSFLVSLSRAAHVPIEVQAPGAVDVGVKGNVLAVNIVEHYNIRQGFAFSLCI